MTLSTMLMFEYLFKHLYTLPAYLMSWTASGALGYGGRFSHIISTKFSIRISIEIPYTPDTLIKISNE